ncbi:MAG: hypothetical protein WBO34_08440 [Gammaproteobacteria bacterium]
MRNICLAAFLLASFLQHAAAATPEYSALTRESTPREGERTGRVFVGKDGVRTEYEVNGEKLVQIINFTTQEVYLLNPGKRSFMRRSIEQAGPAGSGGAAQQARSADPCAGQQGITCKSLGTEAVHGRKAVKWLMTPDDGKGGEMTLWLDHKRHVPLKQVMPNGVTMERRLLGKETVNRRQTEKWEMTVTGPGGSSNVSYQWYDAELDTNVRDEQADVYSHELLEIKTGAQPGSLFRVPGDFTEVKPGKDGSQQR